MRRYGTRISSMGGVWKIKEGTMPTDPLSCPITAPDTNEVWAKENLVGVYGARSLADPAATPYHYKGHE